MKHIIMGIILLVPVVVSAESIKTPNPLFDPQENYWNITVLCGGIFRNAYLDAPGLEAQNIYGKYSYMMVYYSTIQNAVRIGDGYLEDERTTTIDKENVRWNETVKKKAIELKSNSALVIKNAESCSILAEQIYRIRDLDKRRLRKLRELKQNEIQS